MQPAVPSRHEKLGDMNMSEKLQAVRADRGLLSSCSDGLPQVRSTALPKVAMHS